MFPQISGNIFFITHLLLKVKIHLFFRFIQPNSFEHSANPNPNSNPNPINGLDKSKWMFVDRNWYRFHSPIRKIRNNIWDFWDSIPGFDLSVLLFVKFFCMIQSGQFRFHKRLFLAISCYQTLDLSNTEVFYIWTLIFIWFLHM